MNIKLTLPEVFLLQIVAWLGLWLLNDFYATFLTYIIAGIVLAVLLIALIAEGIEPTKVPRRYFYVMALSFVAPVVAALIFRLIFRT